MSISRANLRTAVTTVVRQPSSVVSNDQLDQGINAALRKMSRDLPSETTTALGVDSDALYTLTDVVGSWDEGYAVKNVSYLYEGDLVALDGNHWATYSLDGVAKLKLRHLCYTSVNSSVAYYLTYTAPYLTSADPITVSIYDEDALVALSACHVAQQLAAEAADYQTPDIAADVVNYQEMIDKWLKIAREQKKIYDEHVKATNGSDAGAWGEWDVSHAFGYPMIFHGDRRF